jgi:lipoate-protein ligase A
LDQALLESDDPRPVLRLYAWSPAALSLGYFQPVEAFAGAAREAGVPIVRRPTGGGAIHHDQELTFCLVAEPGRDGYPSGRLEGYRAVHAVIREALAGFGIEVNLRGGEAPLSTRPRDAKLCFLDTTALDLVDAEGLKLVGSAQRHRTVRGRQRVLHHGSIPLEVPSLSPGSGAVNLDSALRGRPSVTWDQLADALEVAFSTGFAGPLHSEPVHPDEHRDAQQRAPGLAVNADAAVSFPS